MPDRCGGQIADHIVVVVRDHPVHGLRPMADVVVLRVRLI
jgi:hypothetical protein